MDDLEYLKKLKEELRRDFERDLAAVEYLIGRRTKRGAIPKEALPATNVLPKTSAGAAGPGRPPKKMNAIKESVILMDGRDFDLNDILKALEQVAPGQSFTRKGVSTALSRLKDQEWLKALNPEKVFGSTEPTRYQTTEKFPRARR